MRRLASFLLIGFALTAGAAEIWRWKDANGVVHYSDNPVPGAERVEVHVTRPSSPSGAPAPGTYSSPAPDSAPDTGRYTLCAVTQPANDASFQFTEEVGVSLAIDPSLQDGHRIEVLLNGVAYAGWPATATSHSLGTQYRGSYTLAVRVLDSSGSVRCSGTAITFHVRQPSLLSPLRRPAQN